MMIKKKKQELFTELAGVFSVASGGDRGRAKKKIGALETNLKRAIRNSENVAKNSAVY